MPKVNCKRCIYYYVTWQKNAPNGCKYFGFKTKMIPSSIVKKSSGNDCQAVQYRQKK